MVGHTVSHYRINAAIGAGGMGEVYRATDTKLGREVALKLLPEGFARNVQAMARFKREAQLLASLNHPNIASIYGLEDADGVRALAMELVEGPTLADRIARGAIPPEEALPIARQVAEGLEYAHERGIVHRDLKPSNIKITPEGAVKILDFGLAKAMGPDDSGSEISNSPTLSLPMTQAGILLGTAAYMAPEQAKAKPVDRRADIWAFGCVLYEMLSGRKAFDGETTSDLLAAVLRSEPDWSALPVTTPAAIQRLLRRCLIKVPRQRLRDIGDARIAIDETLSGEVEDATAAVSSGHIVEGQRGSSLRRYLPWALGATTILVAAIAAYLALQPKARQIVVRFPIAPPESATLYGGGETSISPDGRDLAFVAEPGPDKPEVLWLRPLGSLTAVPIPGTESASTPFWSPDSQYIGFIAGGKLEKVPASGGPVQVLCDADRGGASWNSDGVILFVKNSSLYRVPDAGGTPTLVATPDAAHSETDYLFPQLLPDGRHFLVEVLTVSGQTFIGAGSLGSKTVKHLAQAGSNAIYAPPGFLFYLDQSTLMARPFNSGALRFTGPAVPVAQSVGENAGPNIGYFSVSPAGVLAYQTAPAVAANQMTWFNRAGQKLGTVGQPGVYTNPALSPDGTRVAVGIGPHGKANIWVDDLKRGTASRLTFTASYDLNPVWSADGSRIFFTSNQTNPWAIYQKAADGLGSTQPVFQSGTQDKALDDLSADGRYAIYDTASSPTTNQLWVLPLFGERKPYAFVQGNFGAASAQFSPNGHYVAYVSNETGEPEVYVQTFPQQTGRWEISTSGGVEPMWRRDGKELFYLTPDDKLMAVPVNADAAAFQPGTPKELFQAQLVPASYWRNIYVPSPDGQRFLMLAPAGETKPEPITMIVNWPALLKKP